MKNWKEVNHARMEASFDKFWQANWQRLSGSPEEVYCNRAMCREGWDAAIKTCRETFDVYELSLADIQDEQATLKADADRLAEALAWYAVQGENCRKFSTEGEMARNSLDRDGGSIARAALAAHERGGEV